MIFIISLLLLYFGANAWIFSVLLAQLSSLPFVVKIGISVIYWLCALSFFLLQLLRHASLPLALGNLIALVSTSWFAIILYMVLFYAVVWLLRCFGVTIPYGFWCCVGFTALLLIFGNIQFHHPKVQRLDLEITKAVADTAPLKVVAFSDVHLGYNIRQAQLKQYIQLIAREQPDLILIAGDLIDMTVQPLWRGQLQNQLNELRAPLGVYWVAGNHEYISGIDEVARFMAQTPFVWLRDSVATLPNGWQLVGRDDRSNHHRKSVNELFQSINLDYPIFVIDHQPMNEEVEQIVAAGADVALFGHTHQGQFFPINWITRLLFRYSYGYHRVAQTHLYTSSGLGLWGPPFRIGSQSEMVVMTIRAVEEN